MPRLKSILPIKLDHNPESSQRSVVRTDGDSRSLLEKARSDVVEAKRAEQAVRDEVEPARAEEARSFRELQDAEAALLRAISFDDVQAARARFTTAKEKHEIARQRLTNLYQAAETARVHTRVQEEQVHELCRRKLWLERTAIPKGRAAIYHQENAVAEAERKVAQQRATLDERLRMTAALLREYEQLTGECLKTPE